jgi:hypothetical protein
MFDKTGKYAVPEHYPHRAQPGALHRIQHIVPGCQRLHVIRLASRLALEIVHTGANKLSPKPATGIDKRLQA